jgi:all-trans-retinol 13,14-reductase
VPPSLSHVSLYVGARGTTEELGLAPGNLWVYPGADHDAQVARYVRDPDAPLPVAYLSFPSAKDPDFARRHPGKSTIEVIGVAPYDWFARWEDTRWRKRGDDYDVFKGRLADRLRDALFAQLPQLRDRLEHVELSTPLSTRHFAGHPRGEIYGLSHGPARFAVRALRPRTKIPGLYLTGADICTAGVGGALMGGVLAASVVTRKNLVGAILAGAPSSSPSARARPADRAPASAA